MTFEEFWKNQSGDPYEIGLMQVARIVWEASAEAERKLVNADAGEHMNTQALQHQDELEKQRLILAALKRLWWLDIDGEDGGDADAFLIADALGVLDEFKYTLALEVEK